jgi:hypothetical protein
MILYLAQTVITDPGPIEPTPIPGIDTIASDGAAFAHPYLFVLLLVAAAATVGFLAARDCYRRAADRWRNRAQLAELLLNGRAPSGSGNVTRAPWQRREAN